MTDLSEPEMNLLPDAQFEGVDAVEIKLTLMPVARQTVLDLLHLNAKKVQSRSIYFFDTHSLQLFSANVIFRVRLIADDNADSTVKIRRIKPADIDKKWTSLDDGLHEFKLEADYVGTQAICAASLTAKRNRMVIQSVVAQQGSASQLFSDEQENFLATYAQTPVDMDLLKVLGPVDVLRWKLKPPELDYEIMLEEWMIQNAFDLFELSAKSEPDQAVGMRESLTSWLDKKGLKPGQTQETKTRTALEHLAKAASNH